MRACELPAFILNSDWPFGNVIFYVTISLVLSNVRQNAFMFGFVHSCWSTRLWTWCWFLSHTNSRSYFISVHCHMPTSVECCLRVNLTACRKSQCVTRFSILINVWCKNAVSAGVVRDRARVTLVAESPTLVSLLLPVIFDLITLLISWWWQIMILAVWQNESAVISWNIDLRFPIYIRNKFPRFRQPQQSCLHFLIGSRVAGVRLCQ